MSMDWACASWVEIMAEDPQGGLSGARILDLSASYTGRRGPERKTALRLSSSPPAM